MSELEEFLGQLELLVFAACLLASAVVWMVYSFRAKHLKPVLQRGPRFPHLLVAFLALNAITLTVLLTLASADVRTDPFYIAFYLTMGVAASLFTLLALKLVGVDRADVHERGNSAAPTLEFCALIAGGLAFAGANIGDGPGYWVVVICTVFSMGTLFALALAHIAMSRTIYRILVDRERGTAFRFGCLLIGCGLVLGRSVAGDWAGFIPTLVDFCLRAWPAALMVLFDVIVARILLTREPDGNASVNRAVGVLHILMGCAFVAALGMPT